MSVGDTTGDVSIVLPPGSYRLDAHSTFGDVGGNVPDDPSSAHTITATSTAGDITVSAG